jgi:hypothetical protein
MFFVVFNKTKFELGLEEVSHAIHSSLWNQSFELNFLPEVSRLAPSFVCLSDFIHLESLCESVCSVLAQCKPLVLIVVYILI